MLRGEAVGYLEEEVSLVPSLQSLLYPGIVTVLLHQVQTVLPALRATEERKCQTPINSVVHLDVEDFSEELLRCLLCHKEPARCIQSPLLGAFCLLLAGSLWHKGAYNRTFPCMEANYTYAIKNQLGASKKTHCVFLRSKACEGTHV